jgi:GNAT superfamily N-acetyltransferase
MQPARIEIALAPQPDEVDVLREQIIQFNRRCAGEGNYQPLVLFLRDAGDRIVGGLIGETYWQWFYVDIFWVDELFRGSGYGSKLLTLAEQVAVERGCQFAYLDTFSFQAPEFYQKRGYVVFGELQNFPAGYNRFFLKKDLQPS